MVLKERALSYECIERFEAWMRAFCPSAFDDPKKEFFRGLLFIDEPMGLGAGTAVKAARARTTGRMKDFMIKLRFGAGKKRPPAASIPPSPRPIPASAGGQGYGS
jgi:hypothetical protein